MEHYALIQKFILSVLLGLLIGIDREKKKQKNKYSSFGGARTFPLISFFGALSAYLAQVYNSGLVLAAAFLALTLLIVVSHSFYSFTYKHSGITSEISAMITFFVGTSAIALPNIYSILFAILMTVLLTLKKTLHSFSKNIEKAEFYAGIKFVIITFIILPLLPEKLPISFIPPEFFNPYKTWLYAVIISSISLAGYISIKIIGPKRGIYSTGFIGGIISSTQTASMFSKRSLEEPKLLGEFRNGALLSYISSIIKVTFVLFLINRTLFVATLPSLLSLIVTGSIITLLLMKKTPKKQGKNEKFELKNPFTLSFALEFALFLTVVFALVKLAQNTYGDTGIYITSLLSGIAKIDAITVSMAEQGGQNISYEVASRAIMIGVFFSAVSKSIYSLIFGGRKFASAFAPWMIISGLTGLIVSFIVPTLF